MTFSRTFALTIALLLLATVPAQAADTTAKTLAPGASAPEFTLKDLDGKPHKLSDYRGKVVAVNFWATWCPPCRKELPSMERTYQTLKHKNFVILGVEVGEEWDAVQSFLNQVPVTYPILLDKDSAVSQKWKIIGLPATYLIDARGRIVEIINGGRDWDDPKFRSKLTKLLKANR